MNKNRIYQAVSYIIAVVLAVSSLLLVGDMALAAKKQKDTIKKEVDMNGKYHAALGIQTANELWIGRMAYYEGTQNKFYGTDNADKMLFQSKEAGKDEAAVGDFQDVEIKGNGTYTVSLEGADFQGETTISQLHVATDIPINDRIQFSDVSVQVNGKTIVAFEKAVMEEEENYLQGGMVVLAFNHWREGLKSTLEERGLPENAENGYELLMGTGNENVSITFTVSGFDYDNTEATEEASGDKAAAKNENEADKTEDRSVEGRKNNQTFPRYYKVIVIAVCVVAVIIFAGAFVWKKGFVRRDRQIK